MASSSSGAANLEIAPNTEFHPSKSELAELLTKEPLSKKHRKMEQGFAHQKLRKMRGAEIEGKLAEMAAKVATAKEPKFRYGQSVLHWWSSWFKTASEPPTQLKKKSRPAWFDATIVLALGIEKVRYAGKEWHEHCYQDH